MRTFLYVIAAIIMLWISSEAINVAVNHLGADTYSPQLQSAYVTFSWFMALLLLALTGFLVAMAVKSAWRK